MLASAKGSPRAELLKVGEVHGLVIQPRVVHREICLSHPSHTHRTPEFVADIVCVLHSRHSTFAQEDKKNGFCESIPDSREDELSWDDFIVAVHLRMKSCVKGVIKEVTTSERGIFFLSFDFFF